MNHTECRIETLRDGTDICSLHKQPLQDITTLAEVKNGEYPELMNTFYCLDGKKELTTPFRWGTPPLSGDRGTAVFPVNNTCPVKYRLWKRGEVWKGWVWHAEGHPLWNPIVLLTPEPFTLVLEDKRKLKVILMSEHGAAVSTGEFF
jgi:hypothetical protein